MEEDKNKQEELNETAKHSVFDEVHEGLNVRMVREMFGKSQKELAVDLKVSPKSISNLELQKEITNKDLLQKIVDFFKIDIQWVKTNRPLKGASIHNYEGSLVNQNQVNNSTQTQNTADEITNMGVPFENYEKIIEQRLDDKVLIGKLMSKIEQLENGKINI